MEYLLMTISLIFFTLNAVWLKLFQTNIQKRGDSIFLFFIVAYGLSALFSFASGSFALPSADALIFGGISGIGSLVVSFASAKAYEHGPASLAAIIINMSLSLPIIYSFFAYDEKISLIQYIGLFLMILSIVMSGISDQSAHADKGRGLLWLIFAIIGMLSNGAVSIVQKEYQIVTHGAESSSLVSVSCATTALIYFFIFLAKNKTLRVSSGKDVSRVSHLFIVGTAYAITNLIGSLALFAVNTKIPAVILFPCVNGGIALLSAVVFLFAFKEKINLAKLVSLVIGVIAIVLLAV